jgi:hypothetical protein
LRRRSEFYNHIKKNFFGVVLCQNGCTTTRNAVKIVEANSNNNSWQGSIMQTISGLTININQWNDIAISINGSSREWDLWLNGEWIGEGTIGIGTWSSIGASYRLELSNANYNRVEYEGFDEVRLYKGGTEQSEQVIEGRLGIGTNFTERVNYPLEILDDVSGISAWFSHNVSATGYNTRTTVFDKSRGSPFFYLKDADDYKTPEGDIRHSDFYGHNTHEVKKCGFIETPMFCREVIEGEGLSDLECQERKPILSSGWFEITFNNKVCVMVEEEAVLLDDEINLLRQISYNMTYEFCSRDSSYSWCDDLCSIRDSYSWCPRGVGL